MKKRSDSGQKPFVLDEAERKLFLDAVERFSLFAKSKIEKEADIEPVIVKRKSPSKKHSMIEANLDLHGLTREDASLRLKIFIDRCLFLGFRRVRIIHGKGSGILRTQVRKFLAESPKVSSVIEASPRLGGDGAVIVEIKRETSVFDSI